MTTELTKESCEIFIELADDTGEHVKEIPVTVTFIIEPTEYEGSFLFYPGGAYMEDWETSFKFLGESYTELEADDWVRFIVDKDPEISIDEYIEETWGKQASWRGIPVNRYPDSRSI